MGRGRVRLRVFLHGNKNNRCKKVNIRNSQEPKIKNPPSPKYSVKKSRFLIYSSNMTNDRPFALQLIFDLKLLFPEYCLKVKPHIQMHPPVLCAGLYSGFHALNMILTQLKYHPRLNSHLWISPFKKITESFWV